MFLRHSGALPFTTILAEQDLGQVAPEDLAFVLCVEGNGLGSQALLLCESLRRYGGRYRDCTIWAVAPRADLPAKPEVVAALEALGVCYRALALNETGGTYGTINRIVTGAWAEQHLAAPYLCVLDTDMVFLTEPTFLCVDVGVRPVDLKGTATSGPPDRLEGYWQTICDLAGIPIDALPMLSTTVSHVPIRASYNGGFMVVRRSLGVLAETHGIFMETFRRNLRPSPDATRGVYASTGDTGQEATTWWGSSQAALSAAISARANEIYIYSDNYNIPLHLFARTPAALPFCPDAPVLIHYHYLAAEKHRDDFMRVLGSIGCPEDVRRWILTRCAELPWPLHD